MQAWPSGLNLVVRLLRNRWARALFSRASEERLRCLERVTACLMWSNAGIYSTAAGMFRLKMATRNVPVNVTVTRLEPDRLPERLIEWNSTRFAITAVRTISVFVFGDPDPEPGKCRVTDNKHFSNLLLPVGLAYPKRLIHRMTESWMRDLKREAGSGRYTQICPEYCLCRWCSLTPMTRPCWRVP